MLRRWWLVVLHDRYNNAIDASAQSDEGSHLRYIVLSRLSDEERSAKRQEKAQQGDVR